MTLEAIVAGHVCLDIIPALPRGAGHWQFRPGTLTEVGPATIATGGCVSNTGVALHRLGVRSRLVGRVGDDLLGRVVADLLSSATGKVVDGLLVAPGERTSYTIILSPHDEDRMFLHFPGANDTFTADDVRNDELVAARLFHFGYPPILRHMYADEGQNLARLLSKAKSAGLTTSLDVCYPDPSAPAGRADWRRILQTALPAVDVFLPNLEETRMMLEPGEERQLVGDEISDVSTELVQEISELAEQLITMGAAIVGIKLGDRGLYLRTSSEKRLRDAGPLMVGSEAAWAERELWAAAFDVAVVGTTGAGDAAVAGFLVGLMRKMLPEEAITAACAAGASCVEAADATSGIQDWDAMTERVERGWSRRTLSLEEGWSASEEHGVWIGPRDAHTVWRQSRQTLRSP